jgi:hypothetical protein
LRIAAGDAIYAPVDRRGRCPRDVYLEIHGRAEQCRRACGRNPKSRDAYLLHGVTAHGCGAAGRANNHKDGDSCRVDAIDAEACAYWRASSNVASSLRDCVSNHRLHASHAMCHFGARFVHATCGVRMSELRDRNSVGWTGRVPMESSMKRADGSGTPHKCRCEGFIAARFHPESEFAGIQREFRGGLKSLRENSQI